MRVEPRLCLLVSLIIGAAALRLLPHPPNFAPVTAMALFAGARLGHRGWAVATPLAAMLLSDAALEYIFGWGFHALMPVVYGSLVGIVIIGFSIRGRDGGLRIAMAGVAGSLWFFLVTNYAVWAMSGMYPPDIPGLIQCYAAALPFLGNSVAAVLFYSAVLFGGLALAEKRFPVLGPSTRVLRAGNR